MQEKLSLLGKIIKFFGHKHYATPIVFTTSDLAGPIKDKITSTSLPNNCTIICRPTLFTFRIPARKTKIPKEEWLQKIRQEVLEDIIKIVDKRSENDLKLVYYKRETLLKELKELTSK